MSILRVAVTGPESSGKSDLTVHLAAYFDTSFAAEYARGYLQERGGAYEIDDLQAILKGQMAAESEALASAKNVCFFDTDALVIKVWAAFRFGTVPDAIAQVSLSERYDYYLLCKPDLPWVPDALRESPDQKERNVLFDIYHEKLRASELPYGIICGSGRSRTESAEKLIGRQIQFWDQQK